MNTMDPRLSQGVAVIAAVAIVVLSWQCGYQPAVRAYRRDRQQMAAMITRLAHVDVMVQAAGDMEIWRTRSLQRLATLKSRLPPSSQLPHLLNALVDGVKTQDVKLIDVSQGNVEPVQDGEQPVLVDGQPCARLPVTVTAEGRYHALVQVMQRIMTEAFPSLVGIEQAEFRLNDPVGSQLALTLHLYLYVVGTPTESAPDA